MPGVNVYLKAWLGHAPLLWALFCRILSINEVKRAFLDVRFQNEVIIAIHIFISTMVHELKRLEEVRSKDERNFKTQRTQQYKLDIASKSSFQREAC